VNSKKIIAGLIALLIVVTGAFAFMHNNTRTVVDEKTILIAANGKQTNIAISKINVSLVEGTVVNGKGEESTVSADGIRLEDLIKMADASVSEKVTVYADDEYSAEISKDEVAEEGKAFILIGEDSCSMLVFGDNNSKRNVRNLVRIVVE